MNIKRGFLFLAILLLVLPLINAQVSSDKVIAGAQQVVVNILDLVVKIGTPLFEFILGPSPNLTGDFTEGEFFFIRILLFLLLFFLLNFAVKRLPIFDSNKNSGVGFIIAATISIITVRFMSKSELLFGVLIPYSALGVSIFTLIPAVLLFYLIQISNIGSLGRKIAWTFFIISIIGLWIYFSDILSDLSNSIYIVSIILMFIVLLLDKRIHGYFNNWKLNLFIKQADQRRIVRLQAEYQLIEHVNTPQADARRKAIISELKKLGAGTP